MDWSDSEKNPNRSTSNKLAKNSNCLSSDSGIYFVPQRSPRQQGLEL